MQIAGFILGLISIIGWAIALIPFLGWLNRIFYSSRRPGTDLLSHRYNNIPFEKRSRDCWYRTMPDSDNSGCDPSQYRLRFSRLAVHRRI
jgi:hypothetical protein